MITIGQRKKLLKVFKTGYSKEVQALLEEQNIVSKSGNAYGESFIRHVFNGRNNNEAIENAIFELYQKKIYSINKKNTLRKQILENKKKPEAGTPGN